jgi:hypothetical protein
MNYDDRLTRILVEYVAIEENKGKSLEQYLNGGFVMDLEWFGWKEIPADFSSEVITIVPNGTYASPGPMFDPFFTFQLTDYGKKLVRFYYL